MVALDAYPLADPQLSFVTHGENTTFKVSASTDGGVVERFLLRVHRPSRHGRYIDSTAAIRSELHWLTALRAQTVAGWRSRVRAMLARHAPAPAFAWRAKLRPIS